jgi:hypothetical protein
MNIVEILFQLQGEDSHEIKRFIRSACREEIQQDLLDCFDENGVLRGLPEYDPITGKTRQPDKFVLNEKH